MNKDKVQLFEFCVMVSVMDRKRKERYVRQSEKYSSQKYRQIDRQIDRQIEGKREREREGKGPRYNVDKEAASVALTHVASQRERTECVKESL